MKNFFRKVAFGLKPDEKAPSDPLVWAQKQVESIPEFNWKGKHIYSEKEMRKYWITQRVEENTTLRKKYKNDPEGFRRAERKLEADTGKKLWPANELCIRHAEGIRSDHPVLAKLWYFWGNHFTISDTQTLGSYSTGAYQRDFIRANMDKNFETMATEATLAWPMIMHLDNKENVGPKSESAKQEWRRREKRPATLNENHARELMELHTISPKAGYTQEDVIELAKIGHAAEAKAQLGRASPTDTATSAMGGCIVVSGEKVSGTRHVFDSSLVTPEGMRKWSICEVELPDNLDAWLVLGFTGIGSPTGDMVAGVAKLLNDDPSKHKEMDAISKITYAGLTALGAGNLEAVGMAMNTCHEKLQLLEVSSRELDALVEAVLPHSLGAKLTGAGGGGCMVALTEQPQRVAEAIEVAGGTPLISRLGAKGVRIV